MNPFYGIVTVWVITWRSIWPIVVILGLFLGIAIAATFPFWRKKLPSPWIFISMFVVPLLTIIWAGAFWAAEQSSETHWRSFVHNVLSVLAILTAIGLAIRFRKIHRSWLVILCSIFVSLFSLAAWFVGAMAISNDWL